MSSFFVLSGFVLAPQICTVIGRGRSTRNIAIFWVRRWMRTVPAYVIAMLAVSITAHECGQVTFFDTRSVDSIAYGFLLHLAMQRADIFRHDFRWLIRGGLPTYGGDHAVLVFAPRTFIPVLSSIRRGSSDIAGVAARHDGCEVARFDRPRAVLGPPLIFHLVLLNALVSAFPHASILISLPAYVLILIALAALMYHAVEKPILAQRPDFERPPQIALEIHGPSLPLGAPTAMRSETHAIPSPFRRDRLAGVATAMTSTYMVSSSRGKGPRFDSLCANYPSCGQLHAVDH
ncbi:hypothetical protein ACVWZ4_003700 [Bradyrhizobium sp. USDA 4472]